MKRITVDLEDEQHRQLKMLAALNRTTISKIVRVAVQDFVELEDAAGTGHRRADLS